VVVHGSVSAIFTDNGTRIDSLTFEAESNEYFISRTKLDEIAAMSTPGVPTKSPKITKNANPKKTNAKGPQGPVLELRRLPPSPIGSMQVSVATQEFLEVCCIPF